jgi:hypothetical protein
LHFYIQQCVLIRHVVRVPRIDNACLWRYLNYTYTSTWSLYVKRFMQFSILFIYIFIEQQRTWYVSLWTENRKRFQPIYLFTPLRYTYVKSAGVQIYYCTVGISIKSFSERDIFSYATNEENFDLPYYYNHINCLWPLTIIIAIVVAIIISMSQSSSRRII